MRLTIPNNDIFAEPNLVNVTEALVVPIVQEAGGGWGVALVGTGDEGNEVTILTGTDKSKAQKLARVINEIL
jgi:hypothetical protein